jgi:hypothetical protein
VTLAKKQKEKIADSDIVGEGDQPRKKHAPRNNAKKTADAEDELTLELADEEDEQKPRKSGNMRSENARRRTGPKKRKVRKKSKLPLILGGIGGIAALILVIWLLVGAFSGPAPMVTGLTITEEPQFGTARLLVTNHYAEGDLQDVEVTMTLFYENGKTVPFAPQRWGDWKKDKVQISTFPFVDYLGKNEIINKIQFKGTAKNNGKKVLIDIEHGVKWKSPFG